MPPSALVYVKPPKTCVRLGRITGTPGFSSAVKHMAKEAQALKAESKRRLKETNSKYKAETDEHRLNKVFK